MSDIQPDPRGLKNKQRAIEPAESSDDGARRTEDQGAERTSIMQGAADNSSAMPGSVTAQDQPASGSSATPHAQPSAPKVAPRTDWLAYFVAITLPVVWLFTSYVASNTFIANVKIGENVTTGNFWNTTGGAGPKDSAVNREALIWASSLPNSLYGSVFLLLAMCSDRLNAYMFAMVGNLLTLLASILFAFHRTTASVQAARILMAFGESLLLPQGLRFAGYHSPQSPWADVLSMSFFATANVEMNVLGAVCSTLLLENPNVSFYICVGTSGLSFILLLVRAPIGLDKDFWQFWVPFTIPLDPMVILSSEEKAILVKIKTNEPLSETEVEAVCNNDYPTASLFLYARHTTARLSARKFDYSSPILAGVSLCFFGMTFGILAFAGVGLAHQAKNLSDPFKRLSIYFFVGCLFIGFCWISVTYFHEHSEGSFAFDNTQKNCRKILENEVRIAFHDTKFIHDDNWIMSLPFRRRPASDPEADRPDKATEATKYKMFRSILSALVALLFAMTAFYSGLSVIVTLLDAMGHNKFLLVSLVVFFSSFASLGLSMLVRYNKIGWLCTLAEHPHYYLPMLHLLTATCSLIMSQVDPSTLDSPWMVGGFLTVWSASVLATFSFLIYAIKDGYRSTVGLSSAILDYVLQLSFVLSLALGRLFASSVVSPEPRLLFPLALPSKSHAPVVDTQIMDNAQRSLGFIMGLQLIAALITFGGIDTINQQNKATSRRLRTPSQQEGGLELDVLDPGHSGPSFSTPDQRTGTGIEEGMELDATPGDVTQTRTRSLY